jgi:hypothetical protein
MRIPHPASRQQRLKKLIQPHLKRPTGRPPKSGVQVKVIEFDYQAEKWNKPRRVVCKIEWHVGELFPRVGFIVTNSNVEADRVITVYNVFVTYSGRVNFRRAGAGGMPSTETGPIQEKY